MAISQLFGLLILTYASAAIYIDSHGRQTDWVYVFPILVAIAIVLKATFRFSPDEQLKYTEKYGNTIRSYVYYIGFTYSLVIAFVFGGLSNDHHLSKFFVIAVPLAIVFFGFILLIKGIKSEFRERDLVGTVLKKYPLGRITNFSETLQKFIDTNDFVDVWMTKANLSLSETLSSDSKNPHFIIKEFPVVEIRVKDSTYSIQDIKTLSLTEDDSVHQYFEAKKTLNSAISGGSGGSLSDARAKDRALAESRRIFIEFKDGKQFFLKDVKESTYQVLEAHIQVLESF